MADQTETAGAEGVIDDAARVIHDAISIELGNTTGGEPAIADLAAARALARHGLLADPAVILLRLADLTAQAGKARSTEWLRTCATLPPDQWPPAPAYKGPMVPAAEHEQLQAERDQLRAKVEELTDFAGEQANARRESDRIRNVAAREAADLRDERDTALAQLADKTEYAGEKAREGDVLSLHVDDLTAERDQLKARIDEVRVVLDREWPDDEGHHDFVNDQLEAIRAALQGDQPAEPEPTKSEPCPEGFHYIGQRLTHCAECGLPPWEHAGSATLPEGASPFGSGGWVLKPWKPGEADRLRARVLGAEAEPAPEQQPDARTARSGPTPQGIPADSESTVDVFVPAADAFPEVTDG